jgi:hypothetical protein
VLIRLAHVAPKLEGRDCLTPQTNLGDFRGGRLLNEGQRSLCSGDESSATAFLLVTPLIRLSANDNTPLGPSLKLRAPHRNRIYFPKRICGSGSPARERTCSRIDDSGKHHRDASCLQSMNSNSCGRACSIFALSVMFWLHDLSVTNLLSGHLQCLGTNLAMHLGIVPTERRVPEEHLLRPTRG